MNKMIALSEAVQNIKNNTNLRVENLICDVSIKVKLAAAGFIKGTILSISKFYDDGSMLLLSEGCRVFVGPKIASAILVSHNHE